MANDMFLKIDGIEGSPSIAPIPMKSNCLRCTGGMSQGATMHTGTGGGAGEVSVDDLTFTHTVDRASPILMQTMYER